MNSIECAETVIDRLDSIIDDLRNQEIDVSRKIHELTDELEFLKEWIEEIRDEKHVCLVNKQALMHFIDDGGGLDMFVD